MFSYNCFSFFFHVVHFPSSFIFHRLSFSMSFIFHLRFLCLHFPFPSFSTPAFLSIIVLFRHFPPLLFCPSFYFSVIFYPCFFVHHFPFLHFLFLLFQRPRCHLIANNFLNVFFQIGEPIEFIE